MQQKRAPQPASAYFLAKFGNQIRIFGNQFKKKYVSLWRNHKMNEL